MGETVSTYTQRRSDRLRVVSDAVIGGGMDIRAGQVVHEGDLGEFLEVLRANGAVVDAPDHEEA